MPPAGRSSSGAGGPPRDPAQRALRTLARRISRAPLIEVEGTVCRVVRAKHLRGSPAEPLYYRGSERGARYTPLGGPAGLYLASDQHTAFDEIRNLVQGTRGDPVAAERHDPVTLIYVDARVKRILDLTDSEIRRTLRVSRKSLLAEWQAPMIEYLADRGPMPLTQQIGLAAHITGGVGGILYPSARWKDGRCLVLFPDRLEVRDRVASLDSTGEFAQLLRAPER